MDDSSAVVPGAHRALRRVDAPDSAFSGELVTDGDVPRVRVDAAAVPPVLWEFAAAEHIAGVRDVVRRHDGQDALLPWCPERIDALLARRSAAAQPLRAGEVVTLVGSILRGIAEVGEQDVHGAWWLAEDARPVFAPGEGSGCAGAGVQLIGRVRESCADRALERILGEISSAAHDHRMVVRSIERWESELTEHAAPRPLDPLGRAVFASESVREIVAHRADLPRDAVHVAEHRAPMHVLLRERVRETLSRVRSRLPRAALHGMRVRRALDRAAAAGGDRVAPSAARAGQTGRGRMLLVGAAAAGAVLLGGLLWPDGGSDSVATESSEKVVIDSSESTAPRSPAADDAAQHGDGGADAASPPRAVAAEPTPGEQAERTPEEAAVQNAAELLKRIGACAASDDAVCPGAVTDGSGEHIVQRLGEGAPARGLTLIEDYGDVAVIRLGATEVSGEQMLVLVREDERWLVRDVYDVADQPSDQG